ncbi:MAG: EamA family transporter RarD [Pseudomonadota bacterium]
MKNNPHFVGIAMLISAFLIWGATPIYFKAVKEVSPLEILAHRIVWSFFFLMLVVLIKKQFANLKKILSSKRNLIILLCSTTLVSTNWLVYIWAVLNNHIMDASLGYFILPIFNVFLGMVFLQERLNFNQKICLFITILGVLVQLTLVGSFPWLSLCLALTFGLYSLIRKKIAVDAVVGLTIEIILLLPLALLYLGYLLGNHQMLFATDGKLSLLLIFSAMITAVPLLLFVGGTRRLPLSLVGFFQYISPTCQFLLAVLLYKEPLSAVKLISYMLIWAALGIYMLDSFWLGVRRHKVRGP